MSALSDSAITALASLAAILGLCCLAYACTFLVRDNLRRKRKPKVATVTRSDPPPRLERYCGACRRVFRDPPNERLQWCPVCLGSFSHAVAAVPTPDDEPPTLPEAS
jgi:hypothetical protein